MNTPGKHKAKRFAGEASKSTWLDEIKIKTKYGYLTLSNNPQHQDLKIRILIKKAVGKAVQRNYYKRVLRKYLKDNRSKFNQFNDCVFYYHYKAQATFNDIQNEINNKISGLA